MSADRSDSLLLEDIIEAVDQILLYTEEMNLHGFLDNRLVQDGVIRNFMIIGEAVKRLSSTTREMHADVPWKRMAGMRDKLVHDYLGIDKVAVWLTVERVLPVAKERLAEIREGMD
ncbi:MAG: DUF86 domain-containing protein [Bacteroidetes bacterium]|nr:DUF86 domain-containing protein [Bacteroidota bacterium]MBS1941452.1 DUF86 domain-containing protein [Bacteroidota bacterium]